MRTPHEGNPRLLVHLRGSSNGRGQDPLGDAVASPRWSAVGDCSSSLTSHRLLQAVDDGWTEPPVMPASERTVSRRRRLALWLMGLGWLALMLLIALATGYWGYVIFFAPLGCVMAWRTVR